MVGVERYVIDDSLFEISNVKVVDHKTGLITLGLAPELDSECGVIHQKFLADHHLAYWQLIILPVFATVHILIFSGASGGDESPNYKLGNIEDLGTQVNETLESHHQQCRTQIPAEGFKVRNSADGDVSHGPLPPASAEEK